MIVRGTERPNRLGERIAALGGVVLLVAVLVPIDCVTETSTGGITGQGTAEPPQRLTASDLFGVALVPIVLAASVPLADLVLRRLGRSIAAGVRLASVAAGLIVLGVGLVIDLTYSLPECCDQIYTVPSAEVGLIPALAGGPLLALGTVASWRQSRPALPSGSLGASEAADGAPIR